jgi:catechol 2,3-dioxygenase-like lactoylglutathione lyase family enzyme
LIQIERTDFVSVPVEDLERAERFYSETLGLPRSKGMQGMFAEYETGNVTLFLFDPKSVGREVSPHRGPLALRVPDVAAARSTLEADGISFDGDTIDSGVCHMAFLNDTEGNVLMLHNRYAPPDARPSL